MGSYLGLRTLKRSYCTLIAATLHVQLPEEKIHVCLLDMSVVVRLVVTRHVRV